MYIRGISTNFSLSVALRTVVALAAVSAFSTASAANRNTILDKLESAPSSWQAVDLDVRVNSTPDAPVALGEIITIDITSSQPANFLLAIVDTYGNVKIARPASTTSSASYEYKAAEPVGSYSTYAFASDTEITDDALGLPASGAESYLPIGVKGVDQFLKTLTNHSSKLVRADESQFLVEDENLTAMRGIRKSITKLKDKTPAVKSDPVTTVAKAEVQTPAATAKTTEQTIPRVAMADTQTTQEKLEIQASVSTPKIKVRRSTETKPSASSNGGSLSLDIKFQLNSQELTQTGINALDTLGSALLGLQRSKDLPQIILEGHTDDTGDGAYNLVLSRNRANSARDYLLNRFGLPADSISAQGYGESAPKVKNVDSASRELNRRVELRVVN